MEWTMSIRSAIAYMEKYLLEECAAADAAESIGISPFYLQKGFKIMTGYTMAEYVRCRRLYLAALDVIAGRQKVIDIAYKYGYDTPESFTKAFVRFHGCSPMQIKKDAAKIRVFLPLKVKITIQGGNEMDYAVEKMDGFQVIGFAREFSYDSAYREIPKFWDEINRKHLKRFCADEKCEGDIEETICNCCIGEYGICVDDLEEEGKFRYLIAGIYEGGKVPEGMCICEFPDMEWAKFSCQGQMPEALQAVNTKIFREWLPGNTEYEIAMGANVEWYGKGDISAADYESAIWVPVKRK